MKAMKPRLQSSIMLLSSYALTLGACAAAEPPAPNGQSHWLRECLSTAECGELSCVCGRCSTLCSSDAACEGSALEGALCRSAGQVGTADACEEGHEAVSMCVPSCERDRDCAAVAEGLACESGVCVLAVAVAMATDGGLLSDARAATDVDAGSPSEPSEPPDAGALEPLEDAGPAPPVLLADCDSLRTQNLPAGIEQVFATDGVALLVADEEAVYGIGSGNRLWRVPVDATSAEDLAQLDLGVQELLVDGGELFFGSVASLSPAVVGKVTIADGSILNLARVSEVQNIVSLFATGDAILWLGNDTGKNAGPWRSDRDPGTTVMLASATGESVPHSLQVVGDFIYFAVESGVVPLAEQLFRTPLDGNGPTEPLGEPVLGLRRLLTDGTALFAALTGGQDRLANLAGERGVARVGLEDGAFDLLYPVEQLSSGVLAMDATYLYWTAGPVGGNVALWRGRLDGRGPAVKLVEGWQYTGDLAVNGSFIYWSAFCEAGGHVLRLSKDE